MKVLCDIFLMSVSSFMLNRKDMDCVCTGLIQSKYRVLLETSKPLNVKGFWFRRRRFTSHPKGFFISEVLRTTVHLPLSAGKIVMFSSLLRRHCLPFLWSEVGGRSFIASASELKKPFGWEVKHLQDPERSPVALIQALMTANSHVDSGR